MSSNQPDKNSSDVAPITERGCGTHRLRLAIEKHHLDEDEEWSILLGYLAEKYQPQSQKRAKRMGKLRLKGLVPKDRPMFSSGPEFCLRPGAGPISKTSPTQQLPIEMPPDATWHTIFEGSGSLTGNS